jgi:hypothetical protein
MGVTMQQSYAVPCSYVERLCPRARCFMKKHTLDEAGVCAKGKARCGIPQRARRSIGGYLSQVSE